jgi:hypothetical protein
MKLFLGVMTGLYLAQLYSRPMQNAQGTQRPSYIALRDQLYRPVVQEISKADDRKILKTMSSGVKAYFKSLFN